MLSMLNAEIHIEYIQKKKKLLEFNLCYFIITVITSFIFSPLFYSFSSGG